MTQDIYVHKGDVGTPIVLELISNKTNLVIDVSGSTAISFLFEKPSGDTMLRVGSLYTDGTDGMIEYVTVDGDVDEEGKWEAEGYVVTPTRKFFTKKTVISVYPVIEVSG